MEVPMAIHESGQMYLETIYILSQNSAFVRAIDVGEQLGFTKPSVSRAIGLLKTAGYISVADDGALSLTESGRSIAEKIYERHNVLTKVLSELGVPGETAARDACKMEHVISDETFEAIKKHLKKRK